LIIRYSEHAAIRLTQRSCDFCLDIEEAKIRVYETIYERRTSKVKSSKHNKVFYKYYHDHLSFFVIARKKKYFWIVKSVIIKEGRE